LATYVQNSARTESQNSDIPSGHRVFTVQMLCAQKDPKQINEISADFREECKKYGDVRKVTVYDVRFLVFIELS